MDFRLATMQDLPLLQETYREIIREMDKTISPSGTIFTPVNFSKQTLNASSFTFWKNSGKLFLHLPCAAPTPADPA